MKFQRADTINEKEVLMTEMLGYIWELKNIKGKATRSDLDLLESKFIKIASVCDVLNINEYAKKAPFKK